MIDSCGIRSLELQMTLEVQIDFFPSDFQGVKSRISGFSLELKGNICRFPEHYLHSTALDLVEFRSLSF